MLNRVLITAALALGALALPAAASADDYVPGEVIVHYEDGTSGAVTDTLQDATGTVTEQALPGLRSAGHRGRRLRARDDRRARAIPTWPTRCRTGARTPRRP